MHPLVRPILVALPLLACWDTPAAPPIDGAIDTAIEDPGREAGVDDAAPDTQVELDASEPHLGVVTWGGRDRYGRPWPDDGLPRRPILSLTTNSPLELEHVLLFSEVDAQALREDLERKPIRVAHLRELVETRASLEGRTWELEPQRTLELGEQLIVAIPAWAESTEGLKPTQPFVAELRVAPSAAGAVVVDSWPPAGATGVPRDLRWAAVRFDDEVSGYQSVRIDDVDSTSQVVPCDVIGWPTGFCVRAELASSLPSNHHAILLDTTVLDRGGAPVGPWEAPFSTSSSTLTGLRLLELECLPDEVALGPGCALVDDSAVILRLHVDAPVRAFLTAEAASDRTVAPRGDVRLVLDGLDEGAQVEAMLRLEGLGSQSHHEQLSATTESDLLPITIVEVRPDPVGPEPRQEYVELLNYGDETLSLQGLQLTDHPTREGDIITDDVRVPPGSRILLVGSAFDPEHAADVPTPAGARLLRLDASIGSGGLSNAGEALYLRDPEGRRLSTVDALPSPGSGKCWRRLDEHSRRGSPGDFVALDCTPGAP